MVKCIQNLEQMIEGYVRERKIPGGSLIVSRGDEVIYRNSWGYAVPERQIPASTESIYRLCSMTKPIVAIAVMQLVEQGKMGLDDPLYKFIPEYETMYVLPIYVWRDGSYTPTEEFPAGMTQQQLLDKAMAMKTPASRPISIRDLLSHSSGIGMGALGCAVVENLCDAEDDLATRAKKWADLPLDFEPGTATGYSPRVGFDLLGRVVEIVSGEDLRTYCKAHILYPLGMNSTDFVLNNAQKAKVGRDYYADAGNLYLEPSIDYAVFFENLRDSLDAEAAGYFSGCGGLWGSCEDYAKIGQMLAMDGELHGVRILKPETVAEMRKQGAEAYLDADAVSRPGCVWGLGMIIFENKERMDVYAPCGAYGWSGAFGTYFLIDPASKISFVWTTSVTNARGGLFPVSLSIQALVYRIWA